MGASKLTKRVQARLAPPTGDEPVRKSLRGSQSLRSSAQNDLALAVARKQSTVLVESKQGTFVSHEHRARAASTGEALYGMDKELAAKAKAKYDPALEGACREWVQAMTGVSFAARSSLQSELRSGVVLCELANAVKPGCCAKPSTMAMPFKQMENIAKYLAACEALGVPKHDQFYTVALFENKDMLAVLTNIQALGRAAQRVPGFEGPSFGAKLAAAKSPRAAVAEGGEGEEGGEEEARGRAFASAAKTAEAY